MSGFPLTTLAITISAMPALALLLRCRRRQRIRAIGPRPRTRCGRAICVTLRSVPNCHSLSRVILTPGSSGHFVLSLFLALQRDTNACGSITSYPPAGALGLACPPKSVDKARALRARDRQECLSSLISHRRTDILVCPGLLRRTDLFQHDLR